MKTPKKVFLSNKPHGAGCSVSRTYHKCNIVNNNQVVKEWGSIERFKGHVETLAPSSCLRQ